VARCKGTNPENKRPTPRQLALLRMATEAARLECKESTGRKEKTEKEKHS